MHYALWMRRTFSHQPEKVIFKSTTIPGQLALRSVSIKGIWAGESPEAVVQRIPEEKGGP